MARLLRHVLVVTAVAVACLAGASEALRPAASPSGDPRAGVDRELYVGQPGQRFITAELGRVAAVPRFEQLLAAVAAVVPTQDQPATSPGGGQRSVWDRLADCESGDWRDGTPQPGTARWDYGLTFSHGDIFQGGVNFHPQTWDAYRGPAMPGHAGHATRAQQIAVAERVLAEQGWAAWPVCSRKLGLR